MQRETCAPLPADYDDGYGDGPEDYEHDEDADEWFDRCARLRDGTCMLAGSEECDFECPFRDR